MSYCCCFIFGNREENRPLIPPVSLLVEEDQAQLFPADQTSSSERFTLAPRKPSYYVALDPSTMRAIGILLRKCLVGFEREEVLFMK